ncbi:ABC transporter ATP-binding protein [Demetria terragena]|uniref:ABC transporter ATP-binding protein n=1 Tax=Demetria terragena TaxID=63959 RepID=UPI000686C9DE|nr:ABC transporter ATP-binding protein [Demetria terragena]
MTEHFAAGASGGVDADLTAVKVQDLVRTFTSRGETVHALGPVSLEVERGEFIALLGPSGCGKTTLLNVVAGLLAPSSGIVEVHGQAVAGVPDDVGMMFQRAVLLPWRTIVENVLLPIELAEGKRAARAATDRANELLDMVGLSGFASRMPNELSGGMQQRAAICRMLIRDPQLLLLDEPFGALDEFTREYMNVELLKITAAVGSTALFVTHSITEAVFMANRVVVMSARPGRIAGVVDVDLPADRDAEIVTSEEFQTYVRRARDLLKVGHDQAAGTPSAKEAN